jgi:hypothetical protein
MVGGSVGVEAGDLVHREQEFAGRTGEVFEIVNAAYGVFGRFGDDIDLRAAAAQSVGMRSPSIVLIGSLGDLGKESVSGCTCGRCREICARSGA